MTAADTGADYVERNGDGVQHGHRDTAGRSVTLRRSGRGFYRCHIHIWQQHDPSPLCVTS